MSVSRSSHRQRGTSDRLTAAEPVSLHKVGRYCSLRLAAGTFNVPQKCPQPCGLIFASGKQFQHRFIPPIVRVVPEAGGDDLGLAHWSPSPKEDGGQAATREHHALGGRPGLRLGFTHSNDLRGGDGEMGGGVRAGCAEGGLEGQGLRLRRRIRGDGDILKGECIGT